MTKKKVSATELVWIFQEKLNAHLAASVNAVNLEDRLRDIETDCRDVW